jgi:hypothetical protein
MKLPLSSVWVGDKWVALSKVEIIQYYTVSEKRALQFRYNGEVMESYVEFKEVEFDNYGN